MSNKNLVKSYLEQLEHFETSESAFKKLLHEDFRQIEYPNALNPNGQESDFNHVVKRAGMAGQMLASQTFSLRKTVEQGDSVVAEVDWKGTMKVDAGPLKKGKTVSAHFCFVCEVKDGKIWRQRNYDCFLPFD